MARHRRHEAANHREWPGQDKKRVSKGKAEIVVTVDGKHNLHEFTHRVNAGRFFSQCDTKNHVVATWLAGRN
jgi:hypothetical protein